MQEEVNLSKLSADVPFDQVPAPKVGAGVAQRSEHALEVRGFKGAAAEFEFDGIDIDCVRSLQIALAIDEAAERRAPAINRQDETPGRYRGCLPRQSDVDEAFIIRNCSPPNASAPMNGGLTT
ncbi:MAG: hypothetical protein ACYCS1_10475 [Gammaproteobacteria bacterium]